MSTKDKNFHVMDRMTFFTTAKIGPKRSTTPEGFLLCEEVPIARTGMMIYGPDETPIEIGDEGIAKIFREEEDVFRPETIASAQGKPVVDEHPDDDVTPENWRKLTHGVMLNVRRGKGAMDDLLIGDLLITTPEGIKAVQNGKKEVSLGYEADYEPLGPGRGKQSNIIINHIALVDNGRCGPRCAISDHATVKEEPTMAKRKVTSDKLKALLTRAFTAKTKDELEDLSKEVEDDFPEEAGSGESGDTHIHIHSEGGTAPAGEVADEEEPIGGGAEEEGRMEFQDDPEDQKVLAQVLEAIQSLTARIEALEQAATAGSAPASAGDELTDEGDLGKVSDEDMEEQIKDEAPEGLGEEAVKAKDSAYLGESFRDTISLAEILVPGIAFPTFDRSANPGATVKTLCGFRRKALDAAYKDDTNRAIIDEIMGGRVLNTKKMTCDAVRTVFRSAAVTKKKWNAAQRTSDSAVHQPPTQGQMTGPRSIAELNQKLREHYQH